MEAKSEGNLSSGEWSHSVFRSSFISKSERISVIEDQNKAEFRKTHSLTAIGKCWSPDKGSKLGKDFFWRHKARRFCKLPISWPSVTNHSRKCIFTPKTLPCLCTNIHPWIQTLRKSSWKTTNSINTVRAFPILICKNRIINLFKILHNI